VTICLLLFLNHESSTLHSNMHGTMGLEACLLPYDVASMDRCDMLDEKKRRMVIKHGQATMQGSVYTGEVHIDFGAVADDVGGPLLIACKLEIVAKQDADKLVKMVLDIVPYLTDVVRGKDAGTKQGYMKCLLERFSCFAGDFGKKQAELDDPIVANKASDILQAIVMALMEAFPNMVLNYIAGTS